MNLAGNLRLAAMSAVAVVAVTGGLATNVAVDTGGVARIGPVEIVRSSGGYFLAAFKLLSNPRRAPVDVTEGVRLSQAAQRENPYNLGVFFNLGLSEVDSDGRLTPRGVAYMAKSYDLIEISPDMGHARVGFILQFWDQMPPVMRDHARTEALALAVRTWGRPRLEAAINKVGSARGRAVGQAWLDQTDPRRTGRPLK